jgi:hypothetical protein
MIAHATALVKSPHLFAYIILSLHLFSLIRYLIAGKYGNALYWASAFCMTVAATFMMGRRE